MAITLWRPTYDGSPPTWRVQLVLAEKKLKAQEIAVSMEDKPEELLDINPRGNLPSLRDGHQSVFETNAIIQYLDQAYPQPIGLMPKRREAQGVALTRLNEVSNYLAATFVAVWRYKTTVPPESMDSKRLEELVAALKVEWMRWERYLEGEGGLYLAGGAISLADLSVFPYLASCVRHGLHLDTRYPRLAVAYQTIARRESVVTTWPASWKDTPAEPVFAD